MNCDEFYRKYRKHKCLYLRFNESYDKEYSDKIIRYLDAMHKICHLCDNKYLDEIGNVYYNTEDESYYVVITIFHTVELVKIDYDSDGCLKETYASDNKYHTLEEFEQKKKDIYKLKGCYYEFTGGRDARMHIGSESEIKKLKARIEELTKAINSTTTEVTDSVDGGEINETD